MLRPTVMGTDAAILGVLMKYSKPSVERTTLIVRMVDKVSVDTIDPN